MPPWSLIIAVVNDCVQRARSVSLHADALAAGRLHSRRRMLAVLARQVDQCRPRPEGLNERIVGEVIQKRIAFTADEAARRQATAERVRKDMRVRIPFGRQAVFAAARTHRRGERFRHVVRMTLKLVPVEGTNKPTKFDKDAIRIDRWQLKFLGPRAMVNGGSGRATALANVALRLPAWRRRVGQRHSRHSTSVERFRAPSSRH
jgi:head-tail adaptor